MQSGDPDYMQSLARGLEVLSLFEGLDAMSVSQAAAKAGLSRAVVRRCLYTLKLLGYLAEEADGGRFYLTSAVTRLARGYTLHRHLAKCAQPVLDAITRAVGESAVVGALDADGVVCLAATEKKSIVSVRLEVGDHVPSHCSALGRAILSTMPRADLMQFLASSPLTAQTGKTITSEAALLDELERVKSQGYAIVDGELEEALRSVAVPIIRKGEDGVAVAAINIATIRTRPREWLSEEIAPRLRAAADEIAAALG